jgi:F-type H+-transporting ATPase subunit a
MGSHFTWFNLLNVHHDYTYAAAAIAATILIVLISIVANLALGKGETAVQPAERFSIKGLFEALTDFIVGLTRSILGHHGDAYITVFAAIFFYVVFNNLLGLLPGMTAATANINAALAIGVFSFIFYNIQGFAHAGPAYLKHFMGPVWWMAPVLFPIEIISNLVRPFSLGIRLSVNMTADHAILGTFTSLTKVVVPVIFYGMGTFVSLVQAFVFTLLSIVYVMMATADDH